MQGPTPLQSRPKNPAAPTVLISNSHQPWRGGVAWYELVVESDEGWHYAGANFPGSPFPFLGHNEHLGWTNTVNTPDMVDVYKLELDESGTRYRLDGEWRDLETKSVTLPVQVRPASSFPSPATSIAACTARSSSTTMARLLSAMAASAISDSSTPITGSTRPSTFEEWQGILARMDIPSTNFIYGDEAGNIANIYNAAIPDRVAEVDGKPVNWRGILPGDDSALIWSGPVEYEKLPRYTNPASGWVFEANNNPFLDAGPGSDLSADDFRPRNGDRDQGHQSRLARAGG